MTPVYWLRLMKSIKTNIDGHYILQIKENFQVFTSKPINGINCQKVTETNIKGENKPQYIADIVHKYDSNLHKLTQPNECIIYYNKNSDNLLYFEQKLKSITEFTE